MAYTKTIFPSFNKDEATGQIIKEKVKTTIKVHPLQPIIFMESMCDEFIGVKLQDKLGNYLIKTNNKNEVDTTHFYLANNEQKIFVDTSYLAELMTIEYYSIGGYKFSDKLVATQYDESNTVIETLNDIVTKGRASIDFYNATGSAIQLQDDLEATNIEALATNVILQQAIIDGELEEMKTNITTTSSTLLTTNTNVTNVTNRITKAEKVAYERKFKPRLIKYMWTNNTTDANGNRTIPINRAILDQWLLLFKDLGVDGLELCIHVDYNSITNNMYYQTDLATIQYVITQGKALGVPVYLLKFHQEYNLTQVATMGVETFKTRFKAMVTEVSTMFKNQDIEYMGIFNEWEFFWTTGNSYLPFVLESMAIPKVHGFKVGVSTAGLGQTGFSSWFTVDESVRQASDIFLLNMYPPASAKGSKTTKQDCLSSWETYNLFPVSEKIRTDYVGKPIIVSETGIIDKYEAYFAPGNSKWTGDATNGIAIETYMYGMLESLKEFDVLAVCWWYDLHYKIDTTYYIYANVKSLLRQYINRGGA